MNIINETTTIDAITLDQHKKMENNFFIGNINYK